MSRIGHAIPTGLTTLAVGMSAASVRAQPNVEITGGPDDTGHHYAWTVTNRSEQPIVAVEFPHYLADLFTPPPGWTGSVTHSATEGLGEEGRCIASAGKASARIGKGGSATFALRIAPTAAAWGVSRGQGDVLITFADGSKTTVVAPAPRKESVLSRQLPGAGVAAIAVILIAIAARRRRKRTRSEPRP